MCMACEMDEIWQLYLEQQAAKTVAADGAPLPSGESSTSGNPQDNFKDNFKDKANFKANKPTLICDEPTGE
jgi:hypothetical protein